MNSLDTQVVVPVSADVSGFSSAMKDIESQSKKFGSAFTSTIKSAISNGKSFEDTLKSLALKISDIALNAGLKPLETAVSSAFGNALSGLSTSLLGSLGGGTSVVPFAKGGVVSSPSFFGAGRQVGVMGEAGAEAILPLARGSDGRLGVRTDAGSAPANIIFNVSTPDVQSFKKSEGQISAMLARTAARGRRGL